MRTKKIIGLRVKIRVLQCTGEVAQSIATFGQFGGDRTQPKIRSFKNHHATEATREVAKMITSVDIVVLHELKVFEVRYRKSSHRVGVLSRPILDFHIQSFMGVISKTKNNREHAED